MPSNRLEILLTANGQQFSGTLKAVDQAGEVASLLRQISEKMDHPVQVPVSPNRTLERMAELAFSSAFSSIANEADILLERLRVNREARLQSFIKALLRLSGPHLTENELTVKAIKAQAQVEELFKRLADGDEPPAAAPVPSR